MKYQVPFFLVFGMTTWDWTPASQAIDEDSTHKNTYTQRIANNEWYHKSVEFDTEKRQEILFESSRHLRC